MVPSLTESQARLALDFFLELGKEEPCENILFSPLNLAAALSLLLLGARGYTAAELEKVLQMEKMEECGCEGPRRHPEATKSHEPVDNRWKIHHPAPRPCRKPDPQTDPRPCPEQNVPDYECEKPEGIHTEFHKILVELNKSSTNKTLSFANRLYGDTSIAFIQQFLFCALKLYLTEATDADFHNAPEEVRSLINLWVEIQTHGQIKDLLPKAKDGITCLTDLLLVNALYFKGQWEVQFDKELTKESPFHVNELEDELTYEKLVEWTCETQLKFAEVEVAIPKTKIEKSILALNFFENLGLNDVFDPEKADLSGITSTECVAVGEIIHGASLEIDEDGDEEAETQHCPGDECQSQRACVQFVADHPFLFFVVHNCTNRILFLGRFAKPNAKKGCH